MTDTRAKVLVVEDDPDMRELERVALGYCGGFDVALASNGQEALKILSRQRPSVIVLDLMMPVMDGLTFLAERRKRHIAEDVPVVCLSAGGEEMMAHAQRLGARECMSKPADLDHLCERVSHYCAT